MKISAAMNMLMSGRSSVPASRGASARCRRRRRCRRYRQGVAVAAAAASAAIAGSSAAMTRRPSVWPSGTRRTATETCAVHRGGEEARAAYRRGRCRAPRRWRRRRWGRGRDRAAGRRRPRARLCAAATKASPVSVRFLVALGGGREGEGEIGEGAQARPRRRRRCACASRIASVRRPPCASAPSIQSCKRCGVALRGRSAIAVSSPADQAKAPTGKAGRQPGQQLLQRGGCRSLR